jgi:formiminotetrahydrofolate cyclodeaminase
VSEILDDFAGWLDRLATEPLPGGVASAAMAAAMGAALTYKVARIALAEKSLTGADRVAIQAILDLAKAQQAELVRLSIVDEQAYWAVLEADLAPARRLAWQQATRVPILVAEACRLLLDRLPNLYAVCPPVVYVDLQIGVWLLETGVRAGLESAEVNLRVWARGADLLPFRSRIDALQEAKVD